MERALDRESRRTLDDIGVLMHSYHTALMTVGRAIRPALSALGPNPLPDEPSPVDLATILAPIVVELDRSLRRFHLGLSSEQAMSSEMDRLIHVQERLEEFRSDPPEPAFRPAVLRQIADSLVAAMEAFTGGNERVSEVISKCGEIRRICCLYDLIQAFARLRDLDQELRTIQGYLLSKTKERREASEIRFLDLVRQAAAVHQAFARERSIDLRLPRNTSSDGLVAVDAEEVRRAIGNVIHNAIKYSYQLREPERAWVNLRLSSTRNSVRISVENWGVPIPAVEITSGAIYKMGYRGEKSTEGGRIGSGVGLADTLDIVSRHGGSVLAASVPARPANQKGPYLTTVTIELPTVRA